MEIFYRLDSVPSNSCILLDTPEEARAYPKGSVELGFCASCGFISNTAFDQRLTEYSGRYEETQGYSPTFRAFHEKLARELIEKHDLQGKHVVEIGCGKGEFLHMLCAYGDNEGLGFDPSYREDREQPVRGDKVEFITDYFSDKYEVDDADFVACKMTLEHIPQVKKFIASIRNAVHGHPESVVFFQVPEAKRILSECAFEDIYYEHCSYFTPESLSLLFENIGFEVLGTDIEYGDQYLTVEARYGNGDARSTDSDIHLAELREMVGTFPARVQATIDRWKQDVKRRSEAGQKIVLWGSGSKGVSFLTTLGLGEEIQAVVDINPNRQGYFMAGTGHRIVSPEQLKDIGPDYVIVMNRVYTDEIRHMMSGLGMTPEVAAL
jgi:SAM-dependent methyltransferase